MPDFNAKMHQNRFRLGRSAPDPAGGAYSTPPDPLAGFKGPTSKGKRGRGGEEGEWRGEEGEGRVGLSPPLRNPKYATAWQQLLSDTKVKHEAVLIFVFIL